MTWLRKYWWALLLVLAAVVASILAYLGLRKRGEKVVASVSQHVAERAIEVAKARAKADAEASRKEAEVRRIMLDRDAMRRRRRLAKWLDENL